MPPPLLPTVLLAIMQFVTVVVPCENTPPPCAVETVAWLPFTVQTVMTRLAEDDCCQTPAPPEPPLLLLMRQPESVVGPWTNTPPPPFGAVLPVRLLLVIVTNWLDVCSRTAPPSWAAVLPENWLASVDRLLSPETYTDPAA